MDKKLSYKILTQMAGNENTITVNRAFVEFAGSLEGGMMLSQLIYWTPRSKMQGWIAKSDKEFAEELCISQYGVRKAKSALEGLEVIETKLKKFNGSPTVHYRVLPNALMTKWTLRFPQSDFAKTQEPIDENEETLTETTSEITTKNTTDINSKVIQLLKETGIEEPALSEVATYQHVSPEFVEWRIEQWREKQKTGNYTTGWLIGSLKRKAKPPKPRKYDPERYTKGKFADWIKT